MPQRPFRFLHAADLHLEQPCLCADDAPAQLTELLFDAPLRAATKVFDAAVDQRVDFVVLAGGIANPDCCSPHELQFLVEQFRRLAERNIAVYWSGGPVDSLGDWPAYIAWPDNIRRFPSGRTLRYRHEVAGQPGCEIIGRSLTAAESLRPYDFAPTSRDVYSVAVAHADWNTGALTDLGVNYWALGGQPARSSSLNPTCVAHFAGSPQGRGPTESGLHGCTIVSVDEQRRPHLSPVSCDIVRWQTLQLSLSDDADHHGLEQLLLHRMHQLQTESSGVAMIVTCQVSCQGPLRFALRHGSLGTELTDKLRQEFGSLFPPLWTLSIETQLPDRMPAEWFAEEALRGDFLRALQRFSPEFFPSDEKTSQLETAEHPEDAVELEVPVPKNLAELLASNNLGVPATEALVQLGAFDNPEIRCRVLREVAWLGADLLNPEEAAR